jgi:phosphatidylserine/phosphatidylglycerophosphate/cardiolipin synthase-like enzyme
MVRLAAAFIAVVVLLAGCTQQPAELVLARTSQREAVRLWQDASIFELAARLIEHAAARVLVEVYEIGRQDLIADLVAARSRSADVRVITDPTVGASRAAFTQLAALGVPALFYPIDDAAHQIDHVKLLIADGEAMVGGMNWGVHSGRNHDYVIETRVPAEVARVTQIFEQDWSLAQGRPSPLVAQIGDIGQTAPTHEIRSMLEGAIASARARILAEVYTFTDSDVIVGLSAARRRGVEVRVLLDPNQPYNRAAFYLLRASGVEVRWYPVPPGTLLHAKAGLFDDELLLGSANWTYSGLDVNHELEIETADSRAVASYASRFEADWERSPA